MPFTIRILECFLLYVMSSMILAIFGLWNLIIGIRAVAAASYYVDETSITGKFDFCYQ